MAFSYRIPIASQSQIIRNARRVPGRYERKICSALINNLPRQKLPSKKELPD